jgi:uncharacterized protein (TIGR03083 family)
VVGDGGAAFADAATEHLDAPVASCPGWDVAELVRHLGGIYTWVTSILRAGGQPPGDALDESPSELDALVPWFRQAHRTLHRELGSLDPDDPAWVFVSSAPQNAGWWYRRQAQETSIHRYDAEAAAGQARPLDPELAADGVDEFLTLFLPRVLSRNPVDGLKGTLHMHATDTPGEWSLDLDSANLTPRREHAKADTAVRGPASALNLWLWNRVPLEESDLEVFGDQSVVAAFDRVRF